jgi:hypothetical protein
LRRSLVIASLLTGKLLWTMGGRRNLYSSALPWRLFAFAQFLQGCGETPHFLPRAGLSMQEAQTARSMPASKR